MPIPTPHKGKKPESKNEFVSRCMGDETMKTEYEQKQRVAICLNSWREHTKNASAIVAAKDDEIAYFIEEET